MLATNTLVGRLVGDHNIEAGLSEAAQIVCGNTHVLLLFFVFASYGLDLRGQVVDDLDSLLLLLGSHFILLIPILAKQHTILFLSSFMN